MKPRNRLDVKLRIIEVAAYALTDLKLYEGRTETVPVLGTWDGSPANTTTAMYVGQSTGRSDPDGIASTQPMVDVFEIQCQVFIAGSPDWRAAEQAAETAFNAFDMLLRSLRRLAEPNGGSDIPTASPPVDASNPAPWDVDKAYVTDSVGPYHTFPQPKGTSAIPGVYDFSVAVQRSLQ